MYDEAGVLSPTVKADLETEIDAIEARSGAEVVVYLQVDPDATEASNLAAARALTDQWGIGRPEVDDGFVMLVSFKDDLIHGVLSTYAGVGLREYLPPDAQARLRDETIVPAFQAGDIEGGIVQGVASVDEAIP